MKFIILIIILFMSIIYTYKDDTLHKLDIKSNDKLYILYAVFPKNCGNAILHKIRFFNKLRTKFNNNKNCSYFFKYTDFIFGHTTLPIASLHPHKNYINQSEYNIYNNTFDPLNEYPDDFNIYLYDINFNNHILLGTSAIKSDKYSKCLSNGIKCDEYIKSFISELCLKYNNTNKN